MLHVNVGEHRDVLSADQAPRPHEIGRRPFDDPLVGDEGFGQHVHPDEVAAADGGDSQGIPGTVAQHVHPHGKRGLATKLAQNPAHRGDGLWGSLVLGERRVSHVLDAEAVHAAGLEGGRILQGDLHDPLELAFVARRSGEGKQGHPADDRGIHGEEVGELHA